MTQIRTDNQPVTQITIVDSEPAKQAEALSVMTERARFMARQPGFISISLHRSLDGRRIVNYVQWQNRDLLRSAHQSPEFRKEWGHFDQLTDEIDPNLYEVAIGERAVSYSIKLGKEPNVLMVNDLSSRQAVNQARELKAGNIKFGIYASDGTLTELHDLERAVEGDDVADRTKARSAQPT